eukprot:TRINITY_DN5143_c0_g1_i1.p1 TRINITY_DN5143_c0_g1~~TRINITY_DN5143_c0_g1_i1.p1  ORF type:complete len:315 (-),score=13.88 TRINITY_DN5143_c0_g1_i1:100-1044(-)
MREEPAEKPPTHPQSTSSSSSRLRPKPKPTPTPDIAQALKRRLSNNPKLAPLTEDPTPVKTEVGPHPDSSEMLPQRRSSRIPEPARPPQDPMHADATVGRLCSSTGTNPHDQSLNALFDDAETALHVAQNHLQWIAMDHTSDPMQVTNSRGGCQSPFLKWLRSIIAPVLTSASAISCLSEAMNEIIATLNNISRIFAKLDRHTGAPCEDFLRSLEKLLEEACNYANSATDCMASLQIAQDLRSAIQVFTPSSTSLVITETKKSRGDARSNTESNQEFHEKFHLTPDSILRPKGDFNNPHSPPPRNTTAAIAFLV